ncbi:hypothetical protein HDV01_004759 [Terramyces sp. JEL0728]|nr:hypothetical protein HDV01_004759 [Terramyces sp. JEL0728]
MAFANKGKLPPDVNRALFVRNLPYKITSEDMYDLFGKYGAIRQIRLGNANDTRGTAFVVYEDLYDAKQAQEHLSGFNLQGRYLIVLFYSQSKAAKREKCLLFVGLLALYQLYAIWQSGYMANLVKAQKMDRYQVSFVFMGNKTDYELDNIDKWIKVTLNDTIINRIHADHPLISKVMAVKEVRALQKLHLYPIVQGDFMKIVSLYYNGGASVDLDVIPYVNYPSYFIDHPKTKECQIIFGIEHERYSIEEIPPVRMGQLQTWAMFAQIKKSQFVRKLLDRVIVEIEKTEAGANKIGYYDVQEIAGSGIITDFVNRKACDYLDTAVVGGLSWNNLKMFPKSVVQCKWGHETICVLGKEWTGIDCRHDNPTCVLQHQFRGTWKNGYSEKDLAYKGYYGKPKNQIGKLFD